MVTHRHAGTWRTRAWMAGAAAVVLGASVLAPASAPAAPAPSVQLDLANLPEGPLPAMPYWHTATKEIRDGSRVIKLGHLKKFIRPAWLWKVNGGFVFDRYVHNLPQKPDDNQMMFVDYAGRAKVLGHHIILPGVISSQYGRVAFSQRIDGHTYLAVNDVPSGKRVATRSVQVGTRPIAYRDRVIARSDERVFYWKPGVTAVQDDRGLEGMRAINLRAGQVAYDESPDRIAPYPPGSGLGWTDNELGLDSASDPATIWSPDNQLLAATSLDFGGDDHEWETVHIRRASDGAPVLDIITGDEDHDGDLYQLTWETNDTVLMRLTTNRGQDIIVVRCTTSGDCNRIGEMSRAFPVVPVIRNVS